MDALTFLERPGKATPQPVYVLVGDEAFLNREVTTALKRRLLGDTAAEFAWSSFPGDSVTWAAVRGELETLPFLSPVRIVAIEAADDFVSEHRPALEKYVSEPSKCGVLILEVKSWPSNTRLAKAVPDAATIVCKSPRNDQLSRWCIQRAKNEYEKRLAADAAGMLADLVGSDFGLLDQELAKLAVYVGDATEITRADVDQMVARSRAAETFKIFDAIAEGRADVALGILDHLIEQSEEPLKILGAFSWQLTRLARVDRAVARGLRMPDAIAAAGLQPWRRASFEQQARHLGRRRLARLYDWLLEANLGMKSSGDLPSRLILERLIIRLARPRAS